MTEQKKPESAEESREEEEPSAETTPGATESGKEPEPAADETPAADSRPGSGERTVQPDDGIENGNGNGEAGREDSGADQAAVEATPTGSGRAAAWMALIVALLALALAGWQWWQGRAGQQTGQDAEEAIAALRSELNQDLSAAERNISQLESRLTPLRSDIDSAASRSQLQQLERRFEENLDIVESLPGRMQNLEESMANLQGISAGARDAWLTAEAEYYMQLANAQVQLADNPELAAFALELADRRIRELADPTYTRVRRQLAEEIAALRAVNAIDTEGISLTLASLSDLVATLRLDEEITPADRPRETPPEELSGIARAWAAVKQAFSDVVRVRRTDERLEPLLSPEAAYFLRTNLTLQMQAARLALLKREGEIFRQSLADAEEWLRSYFDTSDQAVTAAIETISEIRDSRISTEMPDVSASLRLFRQQQAIAESDESSE